MKSTDSNHRFVFKSRGLYGLIDSNGRVKVDAKFQFLGECHEGLAAFREGNLFGFIDTEGSVIFEPQFESSRIGGPSFREGKAVAGRIGKQCFIDRHTGQRLFGEFYSATDFSKGLALVRLTNANTDHAIINASGEQISRLSIHEVPDIPDWPTDWNAFSCYVRVGEKLLVGVFSYDGKCIFEPKYPAMTDFFSNIAGFCEHDDSAVGVYGLVTISGEIVSNPAYYQMSNFRDGLARAGRGRREFGYIDTKGSWVIPPQFRQAQPFSEGLACVAVADRKGFINVKGQMVIEPRFIRESSFRNGLASVEIDGKRAYINREGIIVWEISLAEEI